MIVIMPSITKPTHLSKGRLLWVGLWHHQLECALVLLATRHANDAAINACSCSRGRHRAIVHVVADRMVVLMIIRMVRVAMCLVVCY